MAYWCGCEMWLKGKHQSTEGLLQQFLTLAPETVWSEDFVAVDHKPVNMSCHAHKMFLLF